MIQEFFDDIYASEVLTKFTRYGSFKGHYLYKLHGLVFYLIPSTNTSPAFLFGTSSLCQRNLTSLERGGLFTEDPLGDECDPSFWGRYAITFTIEGYSFTLPSKEQWCLANKRLGFTPHYVEWLLDGIVLYSNGVQTFIEENKEVEASCEGVYRPCLIV
jgi:hypothetical protein